MEAKAQSFDAIFMKDVRYVVPVFQRRYAWEKDKQLAPFWSDVREVVDAFVDQAEGGGAPHGSQIPVHFFGAIVVKLVPFGAGQIELREVIDGQQRLTTIQIFLSAAVAALTELGAANHTQILKDLIRNRPYLVNEPDEGFKVWPTKHDRDAFRAVMGEGKVPADAAGHLVVRAFEYFRSAITEWAQSLDDEKRELHYRALEAVIRSQLHIVWIDLDQRDNAQVIFETLNDRGAPLNAIDLVKNLVFQQGQVGVEAEHLYEKHWSWIEDDWWQKKIRLGRLDRVRADVFLQHWLQMRLGREVNSDYLFKRFARLLETEDPDVSELIPEFTEDARLYRSFEQQPDGSRRQSFFERLWSLNTTTPYPLVLLLFKQPASVLAPERVDECLAIIENYLVRRMLWRGSAQGYNSFFSEIVREVRKDPAAAPEIITKQLAAPDGGSRRWPRDVELAGPLTNNRAYGVGAIARHRLLDVLWEVERRRLRTNKHELLPRPPELQIEHVMPQSWREHWPLPAGAPEEAESERNAAIQRLGNLTLVTSRLNPSMSNSAWATKRDALTAHSLLAMNQRLISDHPERFNEADIDTRSREIVEHVLAIWPEPQDVPEDA